MTLAPPLDVCPPRVLNKALERPLVGRLVFCLLGRTGLHSGRSNTLTYFSYNCSQITFPPFSITQRSHISGTMPVGQDTVEMPCFMCQARIISCHRNALT